MCNTVFFSTDSEENFAILQSVHFSIFPFDPVSDSKAVGLLAYANRWFLESRYGGCSCHFRHWMAMNLVMGEEFGPVEDLYSEDGGDVEATKQFFDLASRVLVEGHRLDIVDIWSDPPVEVIRSIDVFLNKVPRDHFRFLEDIRLELTT